MMIIFVIVSRLLYVVVMFGCLFVSIIDRSVVIVGVR